MEDLEVEQKREKLKSYLTKNHALIFVGIFIFAIVIRLYYFFLTKSQPLWWDEADYMAYAKNLAGFNTDWIITIPHNSFFPYLGAGLLKFGFSELILRFILLILPSILLVYLTYKICILLYEDKRIALISSFLMATLWAILFNSMRFHLGVPALFFGFLAIYVFFQGYEKRQKIFGKINPNWAVPLTVFLVVLTYSIRRSYFIFGLFFFVYLLLTKKPKELIRDKYNWIGLGIFIFLILLVENLIFISSAGEVASIYYNSDTLFSLIPLQVFGGYFDNISNQNFSILLYLFWFGFFVLLTRIALHLGYFRKSESKKIRGDLFAALMIILTLSYFLFFQKQSGSFGEPRWYFPLILGAFISISHGTLFITDRVKKYSKPIAIILLVLLIGFGGYYQIAHADSIIKNRIGSYVGIREAGLFVNEIASKEDKIITASLPQAAYYSDRSVIYPAGLLGEGNSEISQDEFLAEVEKDPDLKYLIITFSEPNYPDWMVSVQHFRNDQTGQTGVGLWEIPFLDTRINFVTGEQDIKQSVSFGELEFRIVNVIGDAFIYEIVRTGSP